MVVRIGKMPGIISEILVEEGCTVRQALPVAGLSEESVAGYEIRINNEPQTLDSVLEDDDRVVFAKKVQGNV